MKNIIRPFFSVIISCYNSRKTIGTLLQSLTHQNLLYSDLEIIISDDCSTENYQDIVNKYKNKLFIKEVKTDYNCCPGNTRQKGVDYATGRWIIFSDHDDEFIEDALFYVKQEILQNNINTIYYGKFYEEWTNEKQERIFREVNNHMGWTHGKFFNLDNYWKKYNFHYIKDLKSHEDVCITSLINCVQYANPQLEQYEGNIYVYIWKHYENSLSNQLYFTKDGYQRNFIDKFFIDYLTATIGIIYKKYKEKWFGQNQMIRELYTSLLYSYFYTQFNISLNQHYLKENYDEVYYYLNILKTEFNLSIESIYTFFKKQHPEEYQEVYNACFNATGPFIFEHSLKEWLKMIDNKEY